MKKTKLEKSYTMSGSCQTFPSHDSSLRELRGTPRRSVTRSCFILLNLVLFNIILSASNTSALTFRNNTDVDFTLNPTINVTLSSNDLIIDDLAPGSASDSNIITVGVSTNAGYGYYLSATANASNSNTNLTHETSESSVFTNLSSNKTSLSDFSDNTWGYSYCRNGSVDCSAAANWISGDTGSAITGYNGLPLDNNDSGATGTKLLDTTTYAGSGSVQFKIGAKASNTQAAGTYNGTVNFYAVTYRGPVTFDEAYETAGKTKTLGYYSLQDTDSSICQSVEQGQTTQVIDIRDDTVYRIGKLADDRCWALDNLALDLVAKKEYINSTNTNATDTTLGYLKGTTSRNPNTDPNGNYATAGVINWTSGSYSAPLTNMDSKDVVPQGSDPIASNVLAGNWRVGGYYNYCAASAGSYCYGNGAADSGVSIGSATEDVCPKGWRIPTSNVGGEIGALYSNYSYTTLRQDFHLPLSGVFYNNSANDQGSKGCFWSSARSGNANMNNLFVDTGNILPSDSSNRSYGFSIRCILENQTIQNVTYMQDLTKAIVDNTPIGTTATLKDKRDEQEYKVAKLNDGKLWMTENLNLAGGTALSADTTDVDSNYITNFTTSNNLTKGDNTIILPASSTTGFNQNNYSFVYNSGNKTDNCSAPGCYSYYSWDAATLGSGRSISTDNTDAPYSLCPKGWKLPTSGATSNEGWKRSDFYRLATAYGADLESSYRDGDTATSANFYNNAGYNTIPDFLIAGYYYNSSFLAGGLSGSCQSSTSYSSDVSAHLFYYYPGYTNVSSNDSRARGSSLRCLFRD